MALKIFKDPFVFPKKILTRELMNSAHKISQPIGKYVKNISKVMSSSSHIQSVLIGIEYQNCHHTLDFIYFLLFCLGKLNQN